jgi:hypothetical protein
VELLVVSHRNSTGVGLARGYRTSDSAVFLIRLAGSFSSAYLRSSSATIS